MCAEQGATAAASGGRQDFLIPRAGNQLLRSRAGSVSIYACAGASALRTRRLGGRRAGEFQTLDLLVCT